MDPDLDLQRWFRTSLYCSIPFYCLFIWTQYTATRMSSTEVHSLILLGVSRESNTWGCISEANPNRSNIPRKFFWKKYSHTIYRASTITGHTVYFTKRTGHLKMLFLKFFLYWECSFLCLICSDSETIRKWRIFKSPVRFAG